MMGFGPPRAYQIVKLELDSSGRSIKLYFWTKTNQYDIDTIRYTTKSIQNKREIGSLVEMGSGVGN